MREWLLYILFEVIYVANYAAAVAIPASGVIQLTRDPSVIAFLAYAAIAVFAIRYIPCLRESINEVRASMGYKPEWWKFRPSHITKRAGRPPQKFARPRET